jgi:hypothetical protein
VVRALVIALLLGFSASPALAAEPGPLSFSSAPGPALNIARALLGEESGSPIAETALVQVALVDLDEDGTSEIFAIADAEPFCGTGGCVPRIYRLDAGTATWSALPIESEASLNSKPEHWSIAPAHAGTWSVLQMQTDAVRLYFAWNGTAFVKVERR